MLPSHFITARNIGGTDVYNFVIVFKSIEVHNLFTTYILCVHFFLFRQGNVQVGFLLFWFCFYEYTQGLIEIMPQRHSFTTSNNFSSFSSTSNRKYLFYKTLATVSRLSKFKLTSI